MSVSAKWFGQGLANAYGSTSSGNSPNQDFLSDTIDVALLTSSYTPNYDTHDFWNDASANEVSGTGYSANGAALTTKTISVSSGVVKFDADDTSWASSTITARYAMVYDRTPSTDATRPLLILVDFGADFSTSNGTFQITWDTNGIGKITY